MGELIQVDFSKNKNTAKEKSNLADKVREQRERDNAGIIRRLKDGSLNKARY